MRELKVVIMLSLVLAGEALFSVANIWCILALGGSITSFGLFMSLTSILGFLLQKLSYRFENLLEKDPKKLLSLFCVLGVACSLFFIPLSREESCLWVLYIEGMLFSILAFFISIVAEAIMVQEVLMGYFDSNKASQILQISMQVSVLLGSLASGFLLNSGGMKAVLIVSAIVYACSFLLFFTHQKHVAIGCNSKLSERKNIRSFTRENPLTLRLALIILFLLVIQISSFNFLTPLIAQREKSWSLIQLGLIDAIAGIGSFFSACIFTEVYNINIIYPMAIILGNMSFFLAETAYTAIISSFVLGFCVNILRIKQRQIIYDSVSSNKEIMRVLGYTALITAVTKAMTPLLLGFVTIKPSITFMILGLVVGIGIILIQKIAYLIQLTQAISHGPSRIFSAFLGILKKNFSGC